MLDIRPEQIDAFQRSLNERLAAVLAPKIRVACGRETAALDDAALIGVLTERMAVAQHLGFTRDRDIKAFLTLTFIVSPSFYERDPFSGILADTTIPPSRQIALMLDEV